MNDNPWIELRFDTSGENFNKADKIIKEFIKAGAESNYTVGGVYCLFFYDNKKTIKKVNSIMKKYQLTPMGKNDLTLSQSLSLFK